ncbi:MAG: DNA polymerase I [Nitrospirae bacterium]|nr:MAG: DNA polymerase I [Nitrospirota bacterium]
MNIYLIDGNSYVYRAFYAVKGLTTSKGLPTNAIFGFTNMLLKIIKDKKPDGLIVSFDTPEPTERHMLFQDYKANRPETPDELIRQLPYIRKIVSAFNIRTVEMPGYEADDIIGTIAKKVASSRDTVYIVTADKDMLQLVSDHILIFDPAKDRVLDAAYVREKFGVGPERVTEFMALTGDSADNIPGIKGIGEKTARELLTSFDSLDDLLNHPEKIKKERLRQMVSANVEAARLSLKLATINTDVPLELEEKDLSMQEPDSLSLLTVFRELEFTSFMRLLPASTPSCCRHETVSSAEALQQIISSVQGEVAFDVETTGRNPFGDTLVGIAVCSKKELAHYIPLGHALLLDEAGQQMPLQQAVGILGPAMHDSSIAKIGHNLKFDIQVLGQVGMEVNGMLYDTMIAAYLLNPNKANHSLDEVSFEYLSRRKRPFSDLLKKKSTFAEVPLDEATAYAAEDAVLAYELKDLLFAKLREQGLEQVYFDIEMPLIRVLADIEKAGIKIDAAKLLRLSKKLAGEIDGIQKRIFFLAGEEFNINSPKQLSAVLFHTLGLKPSKKTKTGFSTNVDVLEELASQHEMPKEVLQYRTLTKLKNTYLDVLPAIAEPATGRIHTSFNQTITATGRLSSSEPNLQNIPIRGEWGRHIREAFIADEGNLILSADYSQIELRILAHISQDSGLLEAFTQGLDIHTRTASEIYGVALDRVTQEMRRVAKTVNFGVIYGISAFGLSETLDIDTKEADRFIKQYFEGHPGVREYIETTIADARERGHVCTLLGRRRPIPELRSQNRTVRQQGERFAVNTPIQGTAADIIKIAMINLWERFRRDSLRARMILQVHDELLVELPAAELDTVSAIVREEMEGAISLSVPVRVEIGSGKNWAEAH